MNTTKPSQDAGEHQTELVRLEHTQFSYSGHYRDPPGAERQASPFFSYAVRRKPPGMRDTNSADFLFEPEIAEFIQKVYSTATQAHALQVRFEAAANTPDRQAPLLEKLQPLEDWLASTAFGEAKTLFTPYLQFSNQDWEEPKLLTLRK